MGRNCCRASAVTVEGDAKVQAHRSQRMKEGSKGLVDWLKVSLVPEGRVMNVLKELSEVKSLSRVQLFVTLWTVAYQAPLSMGFSRQ